MQLQSLSHYQAFSTAKMKPQVSGQHDTHPQSELTSDLIERDKTGFGAIGIGSFQEVIVVAKKQDPILLVTTRKTTYTFRSDSQAMSSPHMQQRIRGDSNLWQKVGEPSQKYFQSLALQHGSIDNPWMRARATSDWLGKWDQFRPATAVPVKR